MRRVVSGGDFGSSLQRFSCVQVPALLVHRYLPLRRLRVRLPLRAPRRRAPPGRPGRELAGHVREERAVRPTFATHTISGWLGRLT